MDTLARSNILERIFSSMSHAVIVVDPKGNILRTNPRGAALFQLNTEEAGWHQDRSIPDALCLPVQAKGLKMTIAGEACMVNRTPLYEDGLCTGVISEIQQISQMADYQSLLGNMQRIIEFSSDGLYVVDKSGKTLFVNQAYEDISGYRREELIGHHMADLMSRGYFDQSVSLLVLEQKKRVSILQKIGNKKDVVVTGNPVFDESGDIHIVVTSVRDITHLNQLTDELSKAKTFSKMNQNRYVLSQGDSDEEVVFQSMQMKRIVDQVKQIASFPTSVLLSGPTGAGKEVITNLIHHESDRKGMPFVKVNCGAIPETLLESELFGYVKGAFTGANQEGKIGLLELADKGTVFFDEVAELPMSLQAKLLRAIQDKQIQRVGGNKVKQLDIRIISATNKDLLDMVNQGTFREDLYYRLQVVELHIPPLSERPEDIASLVDHFFRHFCRLYSVDKQMSQEARETLQHYHWPGNVRELKNLIESMIVSVPSLVIESVDLPPHIARSQNKSVSISLKSRIDQFERKLIEEAIEQAPSIRKAAEMLGVDHSTLVKKMKRWRGEEEE